MQGYHVNACYVGTKRFPQVTSPVVSVCWVSCFGNLKDPDQRIKEFVVCLRNADQTEMQCLCHV